MPGTCRIIANGGMAVRMGTKNMQNAWSKGPGPECLFFLGNALPGMSDFYKLGASLPASLAGAFFSEKNPVLMFMYAKPCFCVTFLESRLLQKNEKLRTKSSGARMFTFSWKGKCCVCRHDICCVSRQDIFCVSSVNSHDICCVNTMNSQAI